jgi:hypothetical protein
VKLPISLLYRLHLFQSRGSVKKAQRVASVQLSVTKDGIRADVQLGDGATLRQVDYALHCLSDSVRDYAANLEAAEDA